MSDRLWVALVVVGWSALAAACQLAAGSLGFPDGHLTALDEARAVLWHGTTAVSAVMAVGTLAWGRRSPRRAAAALAAGVGVVVVIDLVLSATLDHGGGG